MARQSALGSSRTFRLATATFAIATIAVASLRFAGLPIARATGESIALGGRDSLGIGLQDVYRITLSDAAPPGGLAVTIDSNSDTCIVARSEHDTGTGAPIVVTVPYRQRKASFVVQSVESPVSSTCDVTATATDWNPDALSIAMVQPQLRIRELRHHHGALSPNDKFFVEAGVPTISGNHLRYVQGVSRQLPADPVVEVCSDQPALGTIVDVVGDDTGADGCESSPILSPFSRTVPGDLQFDPLAGDDEVDITVTASSAGFISGERIVEVDGLAVTVRGPEELGANLQDEYTLRLSQAAASNVSVTVSVSDDQYCVVGATAESLGTASVSRTVEAKHFRASFIVQGVAVTDPDSPCVVTVDAGSFGTDTIEIDVKQPGLRLRDLGAHHSELGPNDEFFVDLGVPDGAGHGLRFVQSLRRGTAPTDNDPLPVTVSSDNKDVGTIVNVVGIDVGDDGEEATDVPLTYSRTIPGNLQFDPVAGDDDPVHVTASAPGFIPIDRSEKDIFVHGASLQITGSEDLGSGLQDDYKVHFVDAGSHVATTVTVTSLTPAVCVVASSPVATGGASVVLNAAADVGAVDFVVQAADMLADEVCELEASTPLFASTVTFNIDVVQGGIEIRDLRRNTNEDARNDPFFVRVGIPDTNGLRLKKPQAVRAGSTIAFEVCSSVIAVGTIVDAINEDNGPAGCEDGVIPTTYAQSVPGNVKFDPNGPGTTLVEVTAPGFATMERTGRVEVNVGGDNVQLSLPGRIGSNLQEGASVRLSRGADAMGTTVNLESLTPAICLVAPDEDTVATATTSVTMAADERSADFTVAALPGLDDAVCIVRATASGFLSDEDESRIVAPAVQIIGLRRASGTTAGPQDFLVVIGVPGPGGVGPIQEVRQGGASEPVTVCSSDPTVGYIEGAGPDGCLTLLIPAGSSSASFTFKVTGMPGKTKITASGGVDATDSVTVHVAETVVNAEGPSLLGKDLQARYFARVNNPGGVDISVSASPTTVCVASLDPTVEGDGSPLAISIPAGDRRAPFTVQALDVGTCKITIEGAGIPTTSIDVGVVYSRLRIRALDSRMSIRDPGDRFFVEIGPANTKIPDVLTNSQNRRGITRPLARRAGAGVLEVKVCTDDAIAIIHQPNHTPPPMGETCAFAEIQEGESSTTDYEFHPVSADVAEVTAEVPSPTDVDDTRFDVTIQPNGLTLGGGHDEIGKDLQDGFHAVFSFEPASGTTVTVTVADGTGDCGVSAGSGDLPEADDQLEIAVDDGRARVDFWIQGIALGDCAVSVSSDAMGSTTDSRTLTVVTPGVQIRDLQRAYSVFSPADPFRVEVGVASANEARLRFTQIVREGAAIPLKVCSADEAVGEVIGGVDDNNCSKGEIPAGTDRIEIFSFDPNEPGNTEVFVEEDEVAMVGLVITDRARVPVKVRAEVIQIRPQDDLGKGLQDQYRVFLSRAPEADADVTLTVTTTTKCQVANDPNGPFGDSTDVTVAEGTVRAFFWVQGRELGECKIDPSSTDPDLNGYEPSTATIDIVDPTLRIIDLRSSFSTQSPDDRFQVEIGRLGPRMMHLTQVQDAGVGLGDVPIKVCSSNTDVGTLAGADMDGCVIVPVAEGESRTAEGALVFQPVGEDPDSDTTTVCAESTGYFPIARRCRTITVSSVRPEINGPDLGAGLQDQYTLRLSNSLAATTAFNINVAAESSGVCTLALDADDAGSASITVNVNAGHARAQFYVHAMEVPPAACVLEIDAPMGSGVLDGRDEIAVIQPIIKIIELDRTQSTQSDDDPFRVVLGAPGPRLRSLEHEQALRSDGAGVTVTVCSQYPLVGEIVGGSGDPPMCKDIFIPPGHSRSAQGELIFHPRGEDPDTDTTVVSATAPGFLDTILAERPVRVVAVSANIHGPDLGAGLQAQYTLDLSRAVSSDVTFTLSRISGMCALANGAGNAGLMSIQVTVPAGRSRALFYVHAFETAAGTICSIEIDAPYSSGVVDSDGDVSIVQPGMRIIQLDSSQSSQGVNDPFYVEIGVPGESLHSLRNVQAARIDGLGVPVNVCSSRPLVGAIVGEDAFGCVQTTIDPGMSRSDLNALQFDPKGLDPSYNVTTVYAYNDDFISTQRAYRDVRVSATVANINGPDLGSGLQEIYALKLSHTLANDTTFTLTSNNTMLCTLATSETGTGLGSIPVTIPAGHSRATFYIHGIEPMTGICEIDIAAPPASGVQGATAEIDVVPSALRIINLDSSQSTQGPDDPFNVQCGIAQDSLSSLKLVQAARSDGPGIPVHVCSSLLDVGELVGDDAYGCKDVSIPPGQSETADGALVFHPIGLNPTISVTTVTATSPNLISTDRASRDVRVAAVVGNIDGPDLGSGLQERYALRVNHALANDTTFTLSIAASSTSYCTLALGELNSGSSSIMLTIPAGRSRASFYVHGYEDLEQLCEIVIDAPAGSGVQDGTGTVEIVKPGLRIIGLDRSQSSQGANDPFYAEIGVPQPHLRTLHHVQAARADGLGVVVHVCSSLADVGAIVGGDAYGCKDVTIAPATSRTADGALYFDPIGTNPTYKVTTVTATNPSFISTDRASIDVTVAPTVVNVDGPALGAGLQDQYTLKLTQAVATDTVFTIAVVPSIPTVCSLALAEFGAGAPSIPLTVPAGRSSARFYVHAYENVANVCELTIDAPVASNVQDGTATIDVVTPGMRLRALDQSQSSQGVNDPFNVDLGVPQPSLRSLAYVQAARADGPGVPVHVCSDRVNVGKILGDDSYGCKDVSVDPGDSSTDELDLVFDPIGQDPNYDTTTIRATNPDFISTDRASLDVKVAPVVANVVGPDLGAGLQDRYTLSLTNALASFTNFTIAVAPSSATTCNIAKDELDTGTPSIVVSVASGRSRASFFIHAFEDASGVCELTIDAPSGSGIQDGNGAVDVIEPSLRIINLDSSQSTQGKDDPFNVESGAPGQSRKGLRNVQAARIDGAGIPVKVCSSRTLVGTIVGAAGDGCKTVTIPPGESRTADNALIFHPVGLDPNYDVTTLTATSDGFVDIDRSRRDVRVAATVANINGPDLGAGLQDQYVLVVNKALASSTNFTIASTDTGICKVASSATATSQASIVVTILAGRDHKELYIHGVAPGTCTLSITPTAGSNIVPGVSDVIVVQAALRIADLDSSQASQGKNDSFRVDVGIPTRSLDGLARVQDARSDVLGGITVSVCSSKPLVGAIVGANAMTGCLSAAIPAGASRTNEGALYFDPIGSDPTTNTTTVTARATGLIPTERADRDVRVSALVANINGPDLGAGLQENYVLALSGAVVSNTTFTIDAADDSICRLALNDNSAGAASINVVIPANRSRVEFYVQGFATGTCGLSITPQAGSGIAAGFREIDVVAAGLRIVNLDSSRSIQSIDDPFNVEIGVPGARGNTLDRQQDVRALSAGVAVEVCSSKPLVGKVVGANVSTGCKTVTIAARTSRTADGVLAFDALGNDPTTDTTHVTATSPGLVSTDAADKEVRVAGIVTTVNGPDEIGAKLEDQYSLVLSGTVANDTVVTIQSEATARCLVSTTEAVTGVGSVNVTVPKGRSRADFFLHGVAEGQCELSLIPPVGVGITGGTRFVDVVTPALKLVDLVGTTKTGAADAKFLVKIGIPSGNLQDLKREQQLRPGVSLTVTVCTNNINVATIIGGGADPACKTATIAANATKTTDGALKLHAVGLGTATIQASAPGFISTDKASKDVQVATGSMNIEGREFIGAGLQDTFTINFSPRTPSPNLQITVTSLTPSVCYVALNEDSTGGTSQVITVPKGRSMQKIAIQGVAAGECTVRVTTANTNYATSEFEVLVVQPAVRLRSLDPTTTGQSANDPFFIDVGVPRDNLMNLRYVQTVRPGTGGLTVQACSSNTGAGVIYNNLTCASAVIPVGSSESPKNAFQFDPTYTGSGQASTTVTASATGHITTAEGAIDVVVAGSALSFIETNIDRVGAGLMDTFKVQSNATVGADKSILITSLTPAICKVAVDENTVAADSVYVVIKAGNKTKTFALHGVAGTTGNCMLKASHAEFADGFADYDIVEPGLRLYDLDTSRAVGSNDDAFKVHIGLPESGLENLQTTQKVRYGTAGLSVTVCSGDVTVGPIVVNNVAQDCHTVTIPAGDYRTADGLLKFRAATNGTTVVEATGAGMVTTDAGSKEVSVTGFGISFKDGGVDKVGAGLQQSGFTIERTGTSGLLQVYVTSLTPSLCVLSTAAGTAGTSQVIVNINSGSSISQPFWIQGKENVLGSCWLSASGGGVYAYESFSIVNAAVRIVNLATTMTNVAANDAFNVEVGIADSDALTLALLQPVRGGSTGLLITVANGNANAAQLVGSNASDAMVSGQSITVRINATYSTNSSGPLQRLEFDPNNALAASGGTSVSASAPNVISTTAATQTVTVTVGGGGCN